MALRAADSGEAQDTSTKRQNKGPATALDEPRSRQHVLVAEAPGPALRAGSVSRSIDIGHVALASWALRRAARPSPSRVHHVEAVLDVVRQRVDRHLAEP